MLGCCAVQDAWLRLWKAASLCTRLAPCLRLLLLFVAVHHPYAHVMLCHARQRSGARLRRAAQLAFRLVRDTRCRAANGPSELLGETATSSGGPPRLCTP